MKRYIDAAAMPMRRYRCDGPIMGTRYTALFYSPAEAASGSIDAELPDAVGAFEINVGDLIDAWGSRPRRGSPTPRRWRGC